MDDESEIPNIEDLEAKLADVTLIFGSDCYSGGKRIDGQNCKKLQSISRDVFIKY